MSNASTQDANAAFDSDAAPEREPGPSPSASVRRDSRGRQQAMLAVGRRVVAPPELPVLMQDAATLLAEMFDVECSATAELSRNGSALIQKLTLDRSEPSEQQTLVVESSLNGSDSLLGYALEVAHPVTVVDLPRETRFRDPFLREQGIRSAVAVPLKLEGRSFGALAACTRDAQEFDADDVLFAESLAHLVTTTIARVETERELTEERRLSAEVLKTVGAMVLVLDPQGRIVSINRVCEQLTGFSSTDVRSRSISDIFPVPEELGLFQTIFKQLREGVSPVEYESILLTKHSDRRQIAWSYSAMRDRKGSITSVVATGIDVTAQRQAEERAARAEQAAERVQATINELLQRTSQEAEATFAAATRGFPEKDEDPHGSAAGRSPITVNAERRRRPRRSYPCRQWIAPMFGERVPSRNDFAEFECNDISSGGFSFWSPGPPQSESVVVALGSPPKLTYLSAQVAHVTRCEHNGQRMYLIGCSYTGRVSH